MIWENDTAIWVWFDVPDVTIATWLAVKLAVQVRITPGK
jgi:hypothetical protein